MIVIPTIDANSQMLETILDDELFYIGLNWNSSNNSWTMSLRNSAYEDVITGIAVAVNYPLTYQFRTNGMPKGELMVTFPKDRNGPVPRDGFQNGYELIYISREELTAGGSEWH